jgi:Fe-Mn family superoxide dismutase
MAFELPELPYNLDALAPAISKQTMEFHYGKHHQAYVNNLNGLIKGTEFENASLETIIMESEGGIFNNAAQIWNHTFYFSSFGPDAGGEPAGLMLDAIKQSYGSFAELKDQFSKAAATLFGSGWVWLAEKNNGALVILQESNAGNPLTQGLKPILTCDVWEHAYYLDYQNRRPDYIKSFWDIIDWNIVGKRF